jgi:hypothetical protein
MEVRVDENRELASRSVRAESRTTAITLEIECFVSQLTRRSSTSLGQNGWGSLFLVLLSACSAAPGPSDAGSHASAALQTCGAPRVPNRVTTIAAAVTRLNELPQPVGAPCFVASLPRPLEVVSTTSIFSAQPATSRESPRIFLLMPALVASVVPDGEGAEVIEFSQWMTPTRTLKAEVVVPITAPVTDEAPYTRVHSNFGVTSCGLCHRNEEPHPTIDGGFISDAFRPKPDSLIPLSELRAQHEGCTAEDQSERCELFHALFDFGEVREGRFSNSVDLFIP